MSKPIIAIDVDDVLAVHAAEFVRYSNQRWGTRLEVDDYDEHWASMWQVDTAETEKRASQYFSENTFRDYPVHEHAIPVLRRLSQRYHLVVVTSRRLVMRDMTLEWLEEHFEGIFNQEIVYFAGIWDRLGPGRINESKAHLVQSLGASYLIDDQLKHVIGAAELGVEAVLFGDYRWNRTDAPLPENVSRSRNWLEVGEHFDGINV